MASWQGFNIFERSTREHVVYNPDLETSDRPISSSSTTRQSSRRHYRPRSPRVLDSRSASRDDPSELLLGCPHTDYWSVGVPVPANGQSLHPQETEEQTTDEHRAGGCIGCFDRYRNAVKNFRNSKYIHILHFLFSHIPISAVIVGCLFLHECPQASYLPGFVTAIGIVGAAFIGIWTALSCLEYRGAPCSDLQKFVLAIFFGLFLIGTTFETCLLVELSPGHDPSSLDYCSEFFCNYLFYKEIAAAVALLFAAFIYIPGSGLYTWCTELPAPLPASAFFNFR